MATEIHFGVNNFVRVIGLVRIDLIFGLVR